MPAAAVTSALPREQSLPQVLRPVHNAWLAETRRFLEPALEPGADFWTRWGAARYLNHDFREQYRLERALVWDAGPEEVATCNTIAHPANRMNVERLLAAAVGRLLGPPAAEAITTS